MSSRVSMNFPRDRFAQMVELGFSAKPEDALDDPSLLVQQHGIGQSPEVIYRFHATPADQNRKRWPEFRDERAHLGGVHIVRNRRDVELIAGEALVELRHVWKLFAARSAP